MLPAVPGSSTARSNQEFPDLEAHNTFDSNGTPFFSNGRKDNVRLDSSCSVLAVGAPAANTLPHSGIGYFTPKLDDFKH